ncbi:MAG: hypothetical protein PHY30_02540 [Candidatus Pacebacteria bacterium]|nr:hypothetical protein [Candidatus Paceibacterota bacterium]
MFEFAKNWMKAIAREEESLEKPFIEIQKMYLKGIMSFLSILLFFFINLFAWFNGQTLIAEGSFIIMAAILFYLGRITASIGKEAQL